MFFFNKINLNNEIIIINKGETIYNISNKLLENDNYFEKNFYLLFFMFADKYYSKINYGKFKLNKDSNILQIYDKISSKSNISSSFCPLTFVIPEMINNTVINSAAVRLTLLRTRPPLRILQAKCFVRSMYG